jgi:hypothetical protein
MIQAGNVDQHEVRPGGAPKLDQQIGAAGDNAAPQAMSG